MREAYKQFSAFVAVGILSTAVQFAVLIGLAELFTARAVWASSLGYLAGGMVNYALNYHKTFHCNIPHRTAVWRFCLVAAIGFLANGFLILLLVEGLGLHYLLGQTVASATVLIWNFFANRYWTFSNPDIGKDAETA